MGRRIDRRSVLRSALGGLVGLSLARFAGAVAAVSKPGTTRLNDNLALVTGVGGNVLALSTNDGLLLVDSGAPEYTNALVAELRGLPGGERVRTVFNTHWHLEHTGANETFGRAGAKIIAHEKTRLWLATDHYVPTEGRYEKARPKEAHPTETFYTSGKTNAGGEQIEYGYLLEAHTDGDIYVFFRDSNVLAVGDAVSPESDPALDWFAGGWLGGRIDSLALLLKLSNEETRIVPGSGPIATRTQVQAEHDMMTLIFDRVVELIRKGYTTQDMLAAGVMDGSSRSWNDPQKFLYDAHKGIWAHHNTLSHDIV
jgi:glyoxylase-like metal-dependent hydrolase (beta-lactamase superfamily II)